MLGILGIIFSSISLGYCLSTTIVMNRGYKIKTKFDIGDKVVCLHPDCTILGGCRPELVKGEIVARKNYYTMLSYSNHKDWHTDYIVKSGKNYVRVEEKDMFLDESGK